MQHQPCPTNIWRQSQALGRCSLGMARSLGKESDSRVTPTHRLLLAVAHGLLVRSRQTLPLVAFLDGVGALCSWCEFEYWIPLKYYRLCSSFFTVTPPIWIDDTGQRVPARSCDRCGREIALHSYRIEHLRLISWQLTLPNGRRAELGVCGKCAGTQADEEQFKPKRKREEPRIRRDLLGESSYQSRLRFLS